MDAASAAVSNLASCRVSCHNEPHKAQRIRNVEPDSITATRSNLSNGA